MQTLGNNAERCLLLKKKKKKKEKYQPVLRAIARTFAVSKLGRADQWLLWELCFCFRAFVVTVSMITVDFLRLLLHLSVDRVVVWAIGARSADNSDVASPRRIKHGSAASSKVKCLPAPGHVSWRVLVYLVVWFRP